MNIKNFALVDLDTNVSLGLYLTSKPMQHRNNLFFSCFDKATGEIKSFNCALSTQLGRLNEVNGLLVKENPFADRFVYSSGGVVFQIRQADPLGDLLYAYINDLLKSSMHQNVETGKKLSVLKWIEGFIPLFNGENTVKLNPMDLPEDAFIYTNDLGVICVKSVSKIDGNNEDVKVSFIKYNDDLEEIEETAIIKDKAYKLYGVIGKYHNEYY